MAERGAHITALFTGTGGFAVRIPFPPMIRALEVSHIIFCAQPSTNLVMGLRRSVEDTPPTDTGSALAVPDALSVVSFQTSQASIDIPFPERTLLVAGFTTFFGFISETNRTVRADIYGRWMDISTVEYAMIARESGTEGG